MVKKFTQLLCICLFLAQNLISQNYHFKNLSREVGLTSNFIRTIHQDGYGYMWFGTPDGLNRYDGMQVEIYKSNASDSTSLNNNMINDIFFTSKAKLLVGNVLGLNEYDYENENFRKVSHFNYTNVSKIVEDSEGTIWIVSYSGILFKLDSNLKRYEDFSFSEFIKRELDVNSSELKF